jgi:hypothetical protein
LSVETRIFDGGDKRGRRSLRVVILYGSTLVIKRYRDINNTRYGFQRTDYAGNATLASHTVDVKCGGFETHDEILSLKSEKYFNCKKM